MALDVRIRHMIPVLIAISFYSTAVYGQNYETGDNSTVTGCSSHCSYKDPDVSCWNTTLKFFERVLLGHMRHYVSVQMNIDQWHRRHQKPHYKPDFDGMRERSIHAISDELQQDDVLTKESVIAVITTLMARVQEKSDHIISWTPHYGCPLPCEYRYSVWRNLFLISVAVNLCLFAALFPYIIRLSRQRNGDTLL